MTAAVATAHRYPLSGRVARWWRTGQRTTAWWAACAAILGLQAADLLGQIERGITGWLTVSFVVTTLVLTLAGAWAWAWRPPPFMGQLLVATVLLRLLVDLVFAYPDSRLVSTAGLGLGAALLAPLFAYFWLSYPTGRLEGRAAWFIVWPLAFGTTFVQTVGNVLYYDARGCEPCSPRVPTYFSVGEPPFSLETWNKVFVAIGLVFVPLMQWILIRKLVRATPGARRTLGPFIACVLAATILFEFQWTALIVAWESFFALGWLAYLSDLVQISVAVAFVLGLAATRRARGVVGDLVVELGRAPGTGVTGAVARAIGDPTAELALWLPERRVWVDEQEYEVALPESGGRAVTYVGEQLAAIVHDPALLDQPALLEAASSAARFALENERLEAELRAQLAELRDSRARIVQTADEERRRLERDLHDGAQQRLLGLGMALQLLRRHVGDDGGIELLGEAESELRQAHSELRELAHGIHPAVLTEGGLSPALRTLAGRFPFPVQITDDGVRLPASVETAAYFLVAEALTNVAKHAHAGHAWISVEQVNGMARIVVRDDGLGGALHVGRGGLRGLADRVGALDGHLSIDSEPGAGTTLVAEMPIRGDPEDP